MHLTFQPLTAEAARVVLAWRYDAEYAFYNAAAAELDRDVQNLSDPDNHYYAVPDEAGALVAYFCYGADARVAGGDYSAATLDVGGGLRPDLTGRGHGAAFISAALEFARQEFAPQMFRTTVAAFNVRAQRACARAGFQPASRFRRAADDCEFVVLLCPDG